MVGEVDSVSATFSMFRGGLFWIGGFLLIFVVIVVLVGMIESGSRNSERVGSGATARRPARDSEATLGLSPQTELPPAP